MKKFVLVDQSIKDFGGHHYEYAVRILRAAEEAGFAPVLLVNKEFKGSTANSILVLPIFSSTFWSHVNYYSNRKSSIISSLRQKINELGLSSEYKNRIKYKLHFSKIGYHFLLSKDVGLLDLVFGDNLNKPTNPIKISKLGILIGKFLRVFLELGKKITSVINHLKTSRIIKLGAAGVVGVSVSPIVAGYWLLKSVRKQETPDIVFANELESGISTFGSEDILFIPNATEAELFACCLLAEKRNFANVKWAFLFRRNIFHGYASSYPSQIESVRPLRLALSKLKSDVPNGNVHFFTDTDELTEQYNLLSQLKFQTVPVPAEKPVGAKDAKYVSYLTLGYLGDARDEKRFSYVQKLVAGIGQGETEVKPFKFLLQSNFNVEGGEPSTRTAKQLLRNQSEDRVELLEGPFDEKEYEALLRDSDVILAPYIAELYSARSSGVFAEAVVCGKPIVVSAGSWMANVAEASRQRKLRSYIDCPNEHGLKLVNKQERNFEEVNRTQIPLNDAADYVFLEFLYDEEDYADHIRVRSALANEFGMGVANSSMIYRVSGSGFVAAFKVSGFFQMYWEAFAICDQSRILPAKVRILYYKSDEQLMLEHGVAIFDDSAADFIHATKRVLDNYEAYRRDAEMLSSELVNLVDPKVLISELEKQSTELQC